MTNGGKFFFFFVSHNHLKMTCFTESILFYNIAGKYTIAALVNEFSSQVHRALNYTVKYRQTYLVVKGLISIV